MLGNDAIYMHPSTHQIQTSQLTSAITAVTSPQSTLQICLRPEKHPSAVHHPGADLLRLRVDGFMRIYLYCRNNKPNYTLAKYLRNISGIQYQITFNQDK